MAVVDRCPDCGDVLPDPLEAHMRDEHGVWGKRPEACRSCGGSRPCPRIEALIRARTEGD